MDERKKRKLMAKKKASAKPTEQVKKTAAGKNSLRRPTRRGLVETEEVEQVSPKKKSAKKKTAEKKVDNKTVRRTKADEDVLENVAESDSFEMESILRRTGSAKAQEVLKKKTGKDTKIQPGVVKRIRDNDAYAMAIQLGLNTVSGDNLLLGSGPESASHRVMPLPLILQIPMRINGMPYGAAIEVAGDKGSNKSSFVLGLANIINGQSYIAPNYVGWCDYISAETKFPDQLVWSVTGYLDELAITRPGIPQPVVPFSAGSMDDWQGYIMRRVKEYKRFVAPERQIPFMMAVDSVTAKFLQETMDKVEAEGVAGRAFAVEAYSLKKFLAKVMTDISSHPIFLLFVNHVARDKEPGKFQETRRKPGGRFMGYQETFDFDLKHIGKTKTEALPKGSPFHTRSYNTIQLGVHKNSMGENFSDVQLFFSWTRTRALPELGHTGLRQRSQWLWGESLTHFLSDKTSRPTHVKERLEEIVKVRYVSPFHYKCDYFDAKQVFRGEELGRMIEMNPKLNAALSELFGITQYPVFKPLTNFPKQQSEDRKKKAKKEFENSVT